METSKGESLDFLSGTDSCSEVKWIELSLKRFRFFHQTDFKSIDDFKMTVSVTDLTLQANKKMFTFSFIHFYRPQIGLFGLFIFKFKVIGLFSPFLRPFELTPRIFKGIWLYWIDKSGLQANFRSVSTLSSGNYWTRGTSWPPLLSFRVQIALKYQMQT